MHRLLIVLFASSLALLSCKKEDQAVIDQGIIEQYILDHNLDAIATGTGLYYVMHTEGLGAKPTLANTVTVHYTGRLTNGTVFDQTTGTPATFELSKVIKGWREGIPYFREGGVGMLLIPSALAYGSKEVGSIPSNSVLVFDIELVEVN
jgi:FKBP-type peptidyl-prolyl cis-trans isomerase FkpA